MDIKPHGGDIYEEIISGKPAPLDFSASISPLGLPDGVKSELAARISEYESYPDPYCRELTAALTEKHGIPPERIHCGAGSADLIFRVTRALKPDRVLVTAPAFSEYERAARESGAEVLRCPLSYPDFAVTEKTTEYAGQADLVFLCNPNNPTGVLTPPDTIKQLLRACEAAGAVLVIDECFMDLTDEPAAFTAEPLLTEHENLIILKAFTKTWAMAGLRLGYALFGSAETAEGVAKTGPPWSVSAPAQIAGIQALKENEYYKKLRALIKEERIQLKIGLIAVGAEVLGGSANYIFFRYHNQKTGINLAEALAAKGILIRDCSNFAGLEDGTYFRIAVRLAEENERLINAISTIVKNNVD